MATKVTTTPDESIIPEYRTTNPVNRDEAIDRLRGVEVIGGSTGGSSGGKTGGNSSSGSPNYSINYGDSRFTEVEADKQQALNDINNTYSGMINDSDKYYQAQIEASKEWAEKQQQLQQENTDFTIEQIEQQKAQANKDYLREQSGAYTDWQKQSNQYGANAEQMAASGLANTGYSESSQVSMYNTYQNRVATARESYNQAVLNYNNSIKDAQLQNNSALAEIAYTALQQQLELSLQGFQYKNQLITDRMNKKLEVDNMYWNRYQDVLNQMNTENALAEDVRQFNEQIQLEREQLQEQIRQYEQDYALRLKEYEEQIRQFNEEMERLRKKDDLEAQMERERLELQKQQMEQEQANWEKEYAATMAKLKAQQESLKSSSISKSSDSSSSIQSKETSIPSFSSYEKAAEYMKKQGVATGDGGLMTKNEWLRRKQGRSKSAEVAYSSYSEYLNAFVAWRMENPQK